MNAQKTFEIVTIAGTRPEIIKISELSRLLDQHYNHALVYTGQHFSNNMKDIFLDELNIEPNFDLQSNTSEIDALRQKLVDLMHSIKPKYIIVYGDTNSSMAGALAAKDTGSKLIHLEAGIRDFDLSVPEERVRMAIDRLSDYLFAPSRLAKVFLEYENIQGEVSVPGNLIVDVCRKLAKEAERFEVEKPHPNDFLLLTLHRQENVDDPEKLRMLVRHLKELDDYDVIFPVHPRTKNNLKKYNIRLPPNVIATDPVGYLEFLYLLKNCRLVLTDSGGVEEEAIVLQKPCITLRHTTPRWETVLLKANVLYPLERQDPLSRVVEMMLPAKITQNPYGEDVASASLDLINGIVSGTTVSAAA